MPTLRAAIWTLVLALALTGQNVAIHYDTVPVDQTPFLRVHRIYG